MPDRSPSILAALGAALCLASCQREEPVRVYEVIVPPAVRQPAAGLPERGPSPAMAATGAATPGRAALGWTAPKEWGAQPLSALTNRGHYLLPEAGGARPVVTISSYPGAAGGLAANLNRWRGQLGLAPQPDAEVEKSAGTLRAGSLTLRTVFLEGRKADGSEAALAGAVLLLPDEAWFFKLSGTKESVEASRAAFESMLGSLKTPNSESSDGPAPGQAPAAAPPAPKPGFTLPAGWKEQPASGMRAASFAIPGPDGMDADISVVRLSGDAGGDLQNINLWRQQLGLPEIAGGDLPDHLKTEKLGEHEFRLFGAASESVIPQTSFHGRILAALATKGGNTWVVRVRGESKHLEAEQENFRAFLSSLRLP